MGKMSKKGQQRRLKRYGHVMRRDEEYVEKEYQDGCGGEEKKRKSEEEKDGHCDCGLEGEGSIG